MSTDHSTETPEAITPTRIIPAGTPLPPRSPEPGETPPWRASPPPPAPPPAPMPPKTAPAAPPAAPPGLPPQWGTDWPWGGGQPQPQGPIELRVQVEMLPVEPELTWRDRLRAMVMRWIRPVLTLRGAVALALAVMPIHGSESAATIWRDTVADARELSLYAGYFVGAAPLALSWWSLTRVGPTAPRLWLLAVSVIGATAAITPYDIIQILTGVAR
ncbi:hypothetical protein [Streptomyces sp. NPDC102437]|uniref:hypothetical protein n=1 Tax=Streptomyces sp. NPDC102437 TaxID=3366175 RepID=UPI00382DDBC6